MNYVFSNCSSKWCKQKRVRKFHTSSNHLLFSHLVFLFLGESRMLSVCAKLDNGTVAFLLPLRILTEGLTHVSRPMRAAQEPVHLRGWPVAVGMFLLLHRVLPTLWSWIPQRCGGGRGGGGESAQTGLWTERISPAKARFIFRLPS